MTIPAGRAASHAWKALPDEVRVKALALARAGQPHPDPEIQRIIVNYMATRQWHLGYAIPLMLMPLFVDLTGFRLGATLHLVLILVPLAIFGIAAGLMIRLSRLRYLGPPNVNAVALATAAPTEPVNLRRPPGSMIIGATLVTFPLLAVLPGVLREMDDYAVSSDTTDRMFAAVFAVGFGLVLAAWLVLAIGMMIIGAGPAGGRYLGTLGTDGIHIRHLKLTVPWQDIRKVATGPDGVTGLAIWLSDQEKTLGTGDLEPWRRKLLLRNAHVTGWLNLPTAPLLAPSTLTVITAIALHRAYLAEVAA